MATNMENVAGEDDGESKKASRSNIRIDFRAMIMLKYIIIGWCDVIFWWTVWNMADILYPITMTTNTNTSFLIGYLFVAMANIIYITTKNCCRKSRTSRPTKKLRHHLYPTSIVAITPDKNPDTYPVKTPVKTFSACVFPVCAYFLTVGFIHIWRCYFALFYYLVEEVLTKYGVDVVVSRLILIFLMSLTLVFNQRNNTINLCPTHKMFKFDQVHNFDTLFKMQVLQAPVRNCKIHEKSDENNDNAEKGNNNTNTNDENNNNDKYNNKYNNNKVDSNSNLDNNKINHNISDSTDLNNKTYKDSNNNNNNSSSNNNNRSDNDAEHDNSNSINNNKVNNCNNNRSTDSNNNTSDDHFEEIIKDPFHHDFNSALHLAELLKRFHSTDTTPTFHKKVCPNTHQRQQPPSLNSDGALDVISGSLNKNNTSTILEHKIPRNEHCPAKESSKDTIVKVSCGSKSWRMELDPQVELFKERTNVRLNTEKTPLKNTFDKGMTESSKEHAVNIVQIQKDVSSNCSCRKLMQKVLSKILSSKTPNVIDTRNEYYKELLIENKTQIYHQISNNTDKKSTSQKGTSVQSTSKQSTSEQTTSAKPPLRCSSSCRKCRISHLIAYIYAIHYEHIFLQTFGAIFWSSTWGLFDAIISRLLSPASLTILLFLVIAVTCHCVNHMVVFRVKESCTRLVWKTLCEAVCGVNTVFFWASCWKVMDIIALMGKDYRVPMLISLHCVVFLGLSISKLSINLAL